jgi:hypothetical protein
LLQAMQQVTMFARWFPPLTRITWS